MQSTTISKGEATRLNIIDAARQLFVRQGYHGTSMRQVAQSASIALGSVYNHFASKEQLFQAVFREYHPYKEVLPALLQAEGDTIEQVLRDALQRMVSALEKRPDFINLTFIEVVEFKSVHANQLFADIFPQLVEVAQRIHQRFNQQMRPIPLAMFIRSYMGMFFSYFFTDLIIAPQTPEEFRRDALEYLLDIYLHGILLGSDR